MLNYSLCASSEGLCSLVLNCIVVNKGFTVYFKNRLQSVGTRGFFMLVNVDIC